MTEVVPSPPPADEREPAAPRSVIGAAIAAPGLVALAVVWGLPDYLSPGRARGVQVLGLLLLLAGGAAATSQAGARLADRLQLDARRCGVAAAVAAGLALALASLGSILSWSFYNGLPLANLPAASACVLALWALSRVSQPERWARGLLWTGLTLGLLLRLALLVAQPAPLWNRDSLIYVDPCHSYLLGQGFTIHPERTPAFSVLHLLLLWLGGDWAQRLAQVALGAAIAGVGGLWLQRRGASLPAALALLLLLLEPRGLYLEMHLNPETLLTALYLAGVLLLAEVVCGRRGLRWIPLSGALVGLAVLAKPVALAVLGACALGAAFGREGWRARLLGPGLFLAGALPVVLGWCLRNAYAHGFFGVTLLGGQVLMATAAGVVDLEGPRDRELKERIRPGVERYRELDDPEAVEWVLYDPGGPVRLLWDLPPIERDEALKRLAVEGILRHPVQFGLDALARGRHYLRPSYGPFYLPDFDQLAQEQAYFQQVSSRAPPELRVQAERSRSSWNAVEHFQRAYLALSYPLYLAAPFLALVAALRLRDRAIRLLTLAGWSHLVLTFLLNIALKRYLLPVMPLFLLACARAWQLQAFSTPAATEPDPGAG